MGANRKRFRPLDLITSRSSVVREFISMQLVIPRMVHFAIHPAGEIPRLTFSTTEIAVVNNILAVFHPPVDGLKDLVNLFEACVAVLRMGQDFKST